ncbi:hypothetical protein ACFY93_27005 [Streptomyces sp. NPDC008313]|uniref:hypothetical protein n=1 Tax=Streptomyces sp. NPDC008313 TaxID=3364826 RepID=UPI0036E6953B
MTYQVVALDPPPEAGLPTVPPGSPGVLQLMTVRSVVFAGGQWADGSASGEAELTKITSGLLQHVSDRVVAYEQGRETRGPSAHTRACRRFPAHFV